MCEHLWQDPIEQIEDPWAEQSVDAQPGVAAFARQHEAVYARVWPEGYPDLMAARDVHVHHMLTDRAAAAARITAENAVFKAEIEEERIKNKGCRGKAREKSPDVPGPRTCPECKHRTWDRLTLGVCEKCGMWRALNDSLKKVKKTAAYDSDDEPPAEAKPKTKVASKKQKKAEAKAAAKAASAQKEATAQKAHQFYRDFVTHHAHGQAPLVSSWEPQQAAASSSWQAPMPSPPPASSSRTPPAPPAPPSRSSSSWEI
jgi:hypothetical protein